MLLYLYKIISQINKLRITEDFEGLEIDLTTVNKNERVAEAAAVLI